MPTHLTHTGVFSHIRWRASDSDFVIAELEDKSTVKGPIGESELLPGITYEFYASGSRGGWQEHPAHGRSFAFTMFTVKIPHSRHGVMEYLKKYGVGIGPVVAARIWDHFGEHSVAKCRTSPDEVLAHADIARHWPREKAIETQYELTLQADLEDTKIGLTNLFANRGFPGALIEECVRKWKVMAPAWITRDPFVLLVNDMSGCGFSRCDKLYTDLGRAPDKLKRQMICLWHSLHADSSGHTWVKAEVAVDRLRRLVSGAKLNPKKAIKLGLRSGWLAKMRDNEGVLWLAEGERAFNEAFVAKKLLELGAWTRADNSEVKTLLVESEAPTVGQFISAG